MSIIYDALKKSQQARAKLHVKAVRMPRNKRKNMIMMLLILSCIFAIITSLLIPATASLSLPMTSRHSTSQKQQIMPYIAAKPRLMLEGVFLSDTEKLALINHRAYHEGDYVNGMKIVSIAFDQVELKNKYSSIKLRSALTQLD